jgi:hypothetical protein
LNAIAAAGIRGEHNGKEPVRYRAGQPRFDLQP